MALLGGTKDEVSNHWLKANQLATIGVLGFGLYQFLVCRFQFFNPDPNCFPSTLGNINMTAQFLLYSLLLQLLHFERSKILEKDWLKWILLGATLTFLYFSYCRSAWVSLFITLFVCFFRSWPLSRTQWTNLLLIAGFLCFFVERYTPVPTVDHQMKAQSSGIRLELWKESFDLIFQNPLGIGTGQFEFGSIPYTWDGNNGLSEENLVRSPHNFFLRVLSEEGILYFLLLMAVTFVLIKPFSQIVGTVSRKSHPWAGLVIIVTGVEAFFQFPFENPYPVFFLSILAPFYWGPFKWGMEKTPLRSVKFFGLTTLLFAFSLMMGRALGRVGENYFSQNLPVLEKLCALTPSDWRLCLTKVQNQIGSQPEKVIPSLKNELEKRPWNLTAFGYWGVFEYQRGNIRSACEILGIRDRLWQGQSDYHWFVARDCSVDESDSPLGAYKQWYKTKGLNPRTKNSIGL